MRYIETSFFEAPQSVSIESTRIYHPTGIDDSYLQQIIEPHRTELSGADLGLQHIFILSENEYITDIKKTYCSISFTITKHKIVEGNEIHEILIYTPCIVTCDNLQNKEECLRYLFSRVLTQIGSKDTRLYFGESTLDILTHEHIKESVELLLHSTIG